MRSTRLLAFASLALALLTACAGRGTGPTSAPAAPTPTPEPTPRPLAVAADVEARVTQFARTPLTAELGGLPESEIRALGELIAASRFLDEIFLRQVWTGNPAMRERVLAYDGPRRRRDARVLHHQLRPLGPPRRASRSSAARRTRGRRLLPRGPDQGGLRGLARRPSGRRRGLPLRLHGDPPPGRRSSSPSPTRRSTASGCEPAAERLRAAAAADRQRLAEAASSSCAPTPSLSDDYYESDVAWMDLDAAGRGDDRPLRDLRGRAVRLQGRVRGLRHGRPARGVGDARRYKERLPWLERNLPIPDEHKNLERGSREPDPRGRRRSTPPATTKAGVQTIAFNLPNDERVREAKGSKKVLLRNMMRAKYDQILRADRGSACWSADQVPHLASTPSSTRCSTTSWRTASARASIKKDGKETEVRLELKELYSPLEEAKADVMGVYNILALIEARQDAEGAASTRCEPTYVAGLFRSARFGVHEAHGQGVVVAVQLPAGEGRPGGRRATGASASSQRSSPAPSATCCATC